METFSQTLAVVSIFLGAFLALADILLMLS